MKLTWHGHACFSLECEDGIVVFDPFENGSVPGIKDLNLAANLTLCSHEHYDHNARNLVKELKNIHTIQYSTMDSYHDDKEGAMRGKNTIHIVNTENMKVVHLGDLGHPLDNVEMIKHCDVLMIPVGGHYTIDSQVAKDVIEAVQPRIVIPMHYRTEEYGFDVISHLNAFTSLFKEVTYYPINNIEITQKTPTQIAILTYQ